MGHTKSDELVTEVTFMTGLYLEALSRLRESPLSQKYFGERGMSADKLNELTANITDFARSFHRAPQIHLPQIP